MSPELVQAALALGGLVVGWLARHNGILSGAGRAAPVPLITGNEQEVLKQLTELLLKQMLDKVTAPKG